MPSRKQRKRLEKQRRHEWEEVYVDSEGNEVPVEEIEADEPPAKTSDCKANTNGKPKAASRPAQQRGSGRVVQPPSWNRVLKRSLIFAPIMFLVVSFLSKDLTLQQKVFQTMFLLAFFIPFSYLMDVVMYRAYKKRTGQTGDSPKKR